MNFFMGIQLCTLINTAYCTSVMLLQSSFKDKRTKTKIGEKQPLILCPKHKLKITKTFSKKGWQVPTTTTKSRNVKIQRTYRRRCWKTSQELVMMKTSREGRAGGRKQTGPPFLPQLGFTVTTEVMKLPNCSSQ